MINQALRLVRSRFPVSKAFLFGSYVEGTADEHSDIDLAVFLFVAEIDLVADAGGRVGVGEVDVSRQPVVSDTPEIH